MPEFFTSKMFIHIIVVVLTYPITKIVVILSYPVDNTIYHPTQYHSREFLMWRWATVFVAAVVVLSGYDYCMNLLPTAVGYQLLYVTVDITPNLIRPIIWQYQTNIAWRIILERIC